MIDMKVVYKKAHSSTQLLDELRKMGKLNEVFKNFSKISKDMYFTRNDNEYVDYIESTWQYTMIYLTDYTCIVVNSKKISGADSVEDCSDTWTRYLASHLQGEEKEKYIEGLKEFANNVAQTIRREMLKSTMVEQAKENIINFEPDNSFIKKEIRKCKVENRAISLDDAQDILDKVREQSLEHSTNSI